MKKSSTGHTVELFCFTYPHRPYGKDVFSISHTRYATVTSVVAVYGTVAPDGFL